MKKLYLPVVLSLTCAVLLANSFRGMADVRPTVRSRVQPSVRAQPETQPSGQPKTQSETQPTGQLETQPAGQPETQPSASADPSPADSPIARASNTRRSLPVLQALMGQWITNGGRTRYHFASDHLTVINLLGNAVEHQSSQSAPRQMIQVIKYEVIMVNEAERVVRLKLDAPLNWLQGMTLRLTPDRQRLTELLDVAGHDLSSQWNYVSEQQP